MSGLGTMLVAISNTCRTQSVSGAAEQASRNEATIISITGASFVPLLDQSDVTVIAKTCEESGICTPTVSRSACLVIMHILATSVASQRGERAPLAPAR
jgi:RpiR family carbohydrate utilization transcriptional regulator